MTNEEIKSAIKRLPKIGINGRRTYPTELKRELVNQIKTIGSVDAVALFYGVSSSAIFRWKDKFEGRIKVRTVTHGQNGSRYSISTKIEAVKQVLEYGNTVTEVITKMGMGHETLTRWIKDYQDGLFNLDHCTQISRKKFRSYDIIIGKIKDAETAITSLKKEAKEALDREYSNKLKEIA